MSVAEPNEPCFGAWLTTTQCRSWDEVITIVSKDWIEADYARRMKEDALSRRRSKDKKKVDSDGPLEEEDLFSIRINKSLMVDKSSATKVVLEERVVGDEGEDTDGCDCSNNKLPIQSKGVSAMKESKFTSNGRQSKISDDLKKGVATDEAKERERQAEEECNANSNTTSIKQDENALALVLYNGGVLKEVTNGLSGLNLKRNAAEDWESSKSKRYRQGTVSSNAKPDISVYTNNLRKTKARVKRYAKRKGKMEKENLLEDEMWFDEVLEEDVDGAAMDSGFVFKEGRDPIGSGHHALVVDCCYCEEKRIRAFKFEANWVQHEEFLRVVATGWNETAKPCQKRLIQWSKAEFPNFRKVIERLRNMLSIFHRGVMTAEKMLEAEGLARQIEETWNKEETYWWQRSGISWLTGGERNTKFFHASVIQRRQRNKILRLKAESGMWLEAREDINRSFSAFYLNLFKSEGSRDMDLALSYVKEVVSEVDNERLMLPVTNQEIESVVFQLGATKAPGES
ncbi:hypothetical protein K1719_012245 [Acacia pycnantha]|nr:hypothetical protein K1719_012245 [Acacia pycnantha]